MAEPATILAAVILAGLAIFQFLLALGLPIGKFAWGGAHKVLPVKLRIASACSIILYGIFAAFTLEKAGLISVINNQPVTSAGVWVLTGYFFIGVLLNGISRSKSERLVMTPTALALALLFLFVAVNA